MLEEGISEKRKIIFILDVDFVVLKKVYLYKVNTVIYFRSLEGKCGLEIYIWGWNFIDGNLENGRGYIGKGEYRIENKRF